MQDKMISTKRTKMMMVLTKRMQVKMIFTNRTKSTIIKIKIICICKIQKSPQGYFMNMIRFNHWIETMSFICINFQLYFNTP